MGQASIDSTSVPLIFLMNSFDTIRVFDCIFICNLCSVILSGAVVYDQDFHVLSAGQKAFDAVSHICGGIIARNRYG